MTTKLAISNCNPIQQPKSDYFKEVDQALVDDVQVPIENSVIENYSTSQQLQEIEERKEEEKEVSFCFTLKL